MKYDYFHFYETSPDWQEEYPYYFSLSVRFKTTADKQYFKKKIQEILNKEKEVRK